MKPVKIYIIHTPIGVWNMTVYQTDLISLQHSFMLCTAKMQCAFADIQQQILIQIAALDMIRPVADKMSELRSVIQRIPGEFRRG